MDLEKANKVFHMLYNRKTPLEIQRKTGANEMFLAHCIGGYNSVVYGGSNKEALYAQWCMDDKGDAPIISNYMKKFIIAAHLFYNGVDALATYEWVWDNDGIFHVPAEWDQDTPMEARDENLDW